LFKSFIAFLINKFRQAFAGLPKLMEILKSGVKLGKGKRSAVYWSETETLAK